MSISINATAFSEESLQEHEAKHENCTEIASISSVSDLYCPEKFVSLSPSSESK